MAKVTKTDIMVRELMNAGGTPNFGALNCMADNFKSDYMKALNWIHQAVAPDTLRGELETLLISRRSEADVPYVADLDGVQMQVLGKIAYCLNRGAELDPKSVLRIRTALATVREQAQAVPAVDPDMIKLTPQGRVNEIYKNCYSRLDNLRAMVEAGNLEIKDVYAEAQKIVEAQGGLKPQVRKRLVDHYTQSVQEALADKILKSWVKPLQEILRAVGGDVKTVTTEAKEKATKVVAKAAKAKATAKDKTAKPVKAKATAKDKTAKPVKAKATAKTKTVNIKPPRAAKVAGVPTVAQQVRELIQAHKSNTTEQGMVEIVIKELGLTKERGRSVVKAFWTKAVA